jgi:hypothetical protein
MSYGCDTWSLTARENEGKFVSDWVLRRMSGLLGGEVRGGWSNMDNAELWNFHSSPNIVRMIMSHRMK